MYQSEVSHSDFQCKPEKSKHFPWHPSGICARREGKVKTQSEVCVLCHLKPNYKMSEKQKVQEVLLESNPQ